MASGKPYRNSRGYSGYDEAFIHCPHDVLATRKPHEIRAEDRCDNAHAANQQRQRHQVKEQRGIRDALYEQRDKHHRCTNGNNIGFKQVSCHTCAVADIIADIIRDCCWVAWIILGDTGFDLTHQISANVGSLGEDTAAKSREDRNERCTECESGKPLHNNAVVRGIARWTRQIIEEARNRQQREARDEHTRNRARAKCHCQAALQAVLRSRSRADV